MTKKFVILGMILGSYAGSYLPIAWGGSLLSMTSLFFGAIGGFVGIWAGYKAGSRFE